MLILRVIAQPRYWEDSYINGQKDMENGDNIPCKINNLWCPVIEAKTGKILNWKQGTTASIRYKVCERCCWTVEDENGLIFANMGYCPTFLSPIENGEGDYIIMDIDADGMIQGWDFRSEYARKT